MNRAPDAPLYDPMNEPGSEPGEDPVREPPGDPVEEPVTGPVDDPAGEPYDDALAEPVEPPAEEPVDEPDDGRGDGPPAEPPVDEPDGSTAMASAGAMDGRVVEPAVEMAADGPEEFATTSYSYNISGDLVEITDSKNNRITFEFDTLGRKILMSDGDLGVWTFKYDRGGNMIEVNDPRPQTTNEEVDSTVVYERDEMGRVVRETWEIESTPGPHTLEYQHDQAGKLTRLIFPDNYEVESRYHDGSGLIHTVTGSDGRQFARFDDYEATGKPGIIDFGSGSRTSYTYSPTTQRLRRISTRSPSGASLQDRWYSYNKTGDIRRINVANLGAVYDFTYDALHRLKSADGHDLGGMNYTYDEIGNITSRNVVNFASDPPASNSILFKYDSKRPHAATEVSVNGLPHDFTYDEAGNMTYGQDLTDPASPRERIVNFNCSNKP
ncbi:MAG: hypothetical protein GY859_29115, partial [Desulfobacterales bacterium]|nr:hypothetical protein [Desulfobacterales bacterium]